MFQCDKREKWSSSASVTWQLFEAESSGYFHGTQQWKEIRQRPKKVSVFLQAEAAKEAIQKYQNQDAQKAEERRSQFKAQVQAALLAKGPAPSSVKKYVPPKGQSPRYKPVDEFGEKVEYQIMDEDDIGSINYKENVSYKTDGEIEQGLKNGLYVWYAFFCVSIKCKK